MRASGEHAVNSRNDALLKAAGAIVVYDVLAALTSRLSSIPYPWFSVGSFLVYVIVGFAVARGFGVGFAAVAGAVAGLTESTLGWAVSSFIGPGRAPMAETTPALLAVTIVYVLVMAVVAAMIGAAVAILTKRKTQ